MDGRPLQRPERLTLKRLRSELVSGTLQSPRSTDRWRPPHKQRRVLDVALLAGLYCLPAAIALRPIVDVDIWWHLRQGAWIVANRTLPLTDPFTSFGMGKSWIAYSWLYELLVYGLYRQFGLFGIVLYTTLMGFAITLALHHCLRRETGDFVFASALTALAVATMLPVLVHPRPWLFNVLFVVLELTLLLDARRSGSVRRLAALPLLFLIWACINIQFVYGLFILAIAAAESGIQRWIGATAGTSALRGKPMMLTLIVCAVATCLTPYHVNIYRPVIAAVTLADPFLFLSELQAPGFRHAFDWLALGLLLTAAFVAGRQRVASPFFILFLLLGAALAFRARRDVWLLVIAAMPILAMLRPSLFARRTVVGPAGIVLAGLVVMAVSVGLAMTRASAIQLDRELSTRFPVGAAAFVERQGLRGHVYNHYDWGGYLIWRLPGLDVTLDGRNPLHGDARIWQSIRTWTGNRDWASDPELSSATLVIADTNMALASLLRGDSRFVLAYEDDVAAVFTIRASRSAPDTARRGEAGSGRAPTSGTASAIGER